MTANAWWIDEPFLRGSGNPTDDELKCFRAEGFGVLVSLLVEVEQPPSYDVSRALALGYDRRSIPIHDFVIRGGRPRDGAPTIEQIQEFLEVVKSVPCGSKMLVHCKGGTGRTGTMAAAYWICKGMSADGAIERVRGARAGAVETQEQEDVLRRFAGQLHSANER